MAQRQERNYKCTLSPHMLNKAMAELNEDPNTRTLEIQTLRERLQRYPGLNSRLDDVFLLKFLRARKFDQERTFKLVLNFYQMKLENPDIYAEMHPSSIKGMFDNGVPTLLSTRAKDGSRIFIVRPGRWDADKHPITDIFKTIYLLLSDAVEDEETQVTGVRAMVDLTGITWNHAKNLTPSFAKKYMSLLQDAFPVRLKGLHYIHEPAFFDVVFTVIRPFMKEKLAARFNIHGDKVESLHEFVDPECLPEEYGGKLPPLDNKVWAQHMLQQDARYQEDNKFGMVDMKMQQQKKQEDAMENMVGSYRKLNVD